MLKPDRMQSAGNKNVESFKYINTENKTFCINCLLFYSYLPKTWKAAVYMTFSNSFFVLVVYFNMCSPAFLGGDYSFRLTKRLFHLKLVFTIYNTIWAL